MDGRSLNFCSVEKGRLRAKSPEIERDSYNVRAEELGVGGGWCRTKRQDPLPSRVMLLWPRHSECQSRKTQRVLSWHGWCSSDVGYSLPPHSRTAQLLYNQNNTSETIIALMTTSQIFYFFSRNWDVWRFRFEVHGSLWSTDWYTYCFDKDASKCSYWKVNMAQFWRQSL